MVCGRRGSYEACSGLMGEDPDYGMTCLSRTPVLVDHKLGVGGCRSLVVEGRTKVLEESRA